MKSIPKKGDKDIRKSFRLKKYINRKEKSSAEFKKEKILEFKKIMNKLSLSKKEKINKIFKIKKIINSLLLSKKEKLVKIKELINKPKKDVYKPIKISGVFSDNFVEYKSDSKKDQYQYQNQYQLLDILIILESI